MCGEGITQQEEARSLIPTNRGQENLAAGAGLNVTLFSGTKSSVRTMQNITTRTRAAIPTPSTGALSPDEARISQTKEIHAF